MLVLSQIFTDRLLLITCSLDLAKSIILHRKLLEERSPVEIPEDWPSIELKNILPYYIEMLEKAPNEQCMQIWLVIDSCNRKIIGTVICKAMPEENYSLDLGYEIISSCRNQGYGYEAVQAIVDWIFENNNIRKITAECDLHNTVSIRLLEKLGMCCIGKEAPFLQWELNREVI